MADYIITKDGELYHYGVKGMKWGVRKAADLARGTGKFLIKTADRVTNAVGKKPVARGSRSSKSTANTKNTDPHRARVEKAKKAAKIGAAVVGTAIAAYGVYKISKFVSANRVNKGKTAIAGLTNHGFVGSLDRKESKRINAEWLASKKRPTQHDIAFARNKQWMIDNIPGISPSDIRDPYRR